MLFRPPYGAHDARIDAIVEEEGLTLTLWSYSADPRDWDTPDGEGKPAAEVCETVVEKARAGDLILLHDRLAGTVEAVPCIIRGLGSEGWSRGGWCGPASRRSRTTEVWSRWFHRGARHHCRR